MRNHALILSAVYIISYVYLAFRYEWLEMFSPRGGVTGLAAYLSFSVALIWLGRKANADIVWRWQMVIGGWVLLLMPPVWFLIYLGAYT